LLFRVWDRTDVAMSEGALCGIVSIWGYCGYRLSEGGGHDSIIRTSAQPY
jgi:hypothetical protein